MMGHTEGFELLDEEEAAMSSGADAAVGVGSKRSKSKVEKQVNYYYSTGGGCEKTTTLCSAVGNLV